LHQAHSDVSLAANVELLFAAELQAAGQGEIGIIANEMKAVDTECLLIDRESQRTTVANLDLLNLGVEI
jgi:hypothetical protein